MKKRPVPGICVHCLEFSEELTWDHVLPESWYPDSAPNNIEKWKVPSCQKCNKSLGVVEEDLLLRLGLCLDPKLIDALGISNKALRSVTPAFGKTERDKNVRQHKREKLLKETLHFDELPDKGLFPNFGTQSGLTYDGYHAIPIFEDTFQIYAEKLVRGMSYIIDKKMLERNCSIKLVILDDKKDQPMRELFNKPTDSFNRGRNFIVKRLVREDHQAWIYEFEIWKRLRFYVLVNL